MDAHDYLDKELVGIHELDSKMFMAKLLWIYVRVCVMVVSFSFVSPCLYVRNHFLLICVVLGGTHFALAWQDSLAVFKAVGHVFVGHGWLF